MKQLQFVLPAVKKLPLEYLVGAGRGQGRRLPAPVRLSARSKLSRECEAMTMSRQSADTISSTWSHGEEGRESGLDIPLSLQFIAGNHGEQASSIFG